MNILLLPDYLCSASVGKCWFMQQQALYYRWFKTRWQIRLTMMIIVDNVKWYLCGIRWCSMALMKNPKTAIFNTRNKFFYFIWKGFLCGLVQWRIYDWRNQISIGGKSYIMCISMMMMQWRGKITCLCAHNFQSIIH